MEPATTEWNDLVVFIPSKDSLLRCCCDLWKLNAVKIRDLYPLFWIDECMDRSGEVAVFSKLDGTSEYWQKAIDQQNDNNTAFKSRCALHRFTNMAFAQNNASSTVQRAVDVIHCLCVQVFRRSLVTRCSIHLKISAGLYGKGKKPTVTTV